MAGLLVLLPSVAGATTPVWRLSVSLPAPSVPIGVSCGSASVC
jgi:hypothetical protein